MGAPSTTKCSRWILRGFKKVTVFCSRLPTNYARAGFQPKSPAYNARAGFQLESPANYARAGFQPKSPQICSRRRRTIFHLLHGVEDGFDICSVFYYTKYRPEFSMLRSIQARYKKFDADLYVLREDEGGRKKLGARSE